MRTGAATPDGAVIECELAEEEENEATHLSGALAAHKVAPRTGLGFRMAVFLRSIHSEL